MVSSGLGAMGLPMARNLIDAGFKLSIFHRTKSKADELVAMGAKVVDTPAEVASVDAVTGSIFAALVFKIYAGILPSGIPEPGFKLPLALKDINLALTTGETVNVTMPIVSVLRDHPNRQCCQGTWKVGRDCLTAGCA